MSFGGVIRQNRKKNRMTVTELGGKVGVSASCISKYENDILNPSTEKLIKLANVLGISPRDFFLPDDLVRSDYEKQFVPAPAGHSELGAEVFWHNFYPKNSDDKRMFKVAEDVCPDPEAMAYRVTDNSLKECGILNKDVVLFSRRIPPRAKQPCFIIDRKRHAFLRILAAEGTAQITTITGDGKLVVTEWKRKEIEGVYPIVCVVRSLLGLGIFKPEAEPLAKQNGTDREED